MFKKISNHYSVSTEGVVRNDKTGKILKPQRDTNGYLRVFVDSKWRGVHNLVAEAFVPNTEGLPEVNHKDGNKENNREDNLEWTTRSGNVLHSLNLKGKRRIDREGVLCIETGAVYPTIEAAAKAVGRSSMAIRKCLYGWTKTCAGLHWRDLYDCESRSDSRGESEDLFLCKSRWEEYYGVPEEQSAM